MFSSGQVFRTLYELWLAINGNYKDRYMLIRTQIQSRGVDYFSKFN